MDNIKPLRNKEKFNTARKTSAVNRGEVVVKYDSISVTILIKVLPEWECDGWTTLDNIRQANINKIEQAKLDNKR